VELVVHGQDGALYDITQNAPNADFGIWTSLPSVSSTPGWVALSRQQNGGLLAFAAKQDGSLSDDAQSGSPRRFGPGTWSSLSGVQESAPAAAQEQDGRVLVFAKGWDSALWYKWQTSNNSGFVDNWDLLGGVLRSAPAVVRQQDGRLLVFAKGSDNALWHTWQQDTNGGFKTKPLFGPPVVNWAKDGGGINGQPVAAQQQDGRVLVFAEGSDGALWYMWQTSNNSGFSDWNSLGGNIGVTFDEAPAVVQQQDGRLLVFARFTDDNTIRFRRQSARNSGFDDWVRLGAGTNGPAAAVQQQDGRVLVFAVGTDGYLKYQRQTTPNGGFDGQWAPVGLQPKSLDMTRTDGGTCGGSTGISCWQKDDQYRDHLNMDAGHLDFVTTLGPGVSLPQSGRFIYVYRTTDNQILIRRYDRAHVNVPPLPPGHTDETSCLDYAKYRDQDNLSKRPQQYMHVRHSQLNGGWQPVWCAGELRIRNGQFDAINNESGHFQPSATCVAAVITKLRLDGYAFTPGFRSGDYRQVKSEETDCPPDPSPAPGPDDPDEL
jgi:hypothetical protein